MAGVREHMHCITRWSQPKPLPLAQAVALTRLAKQRSVDGQTPSPSLGITLRDRLCA